MMIEGISRSAGWLAAPSRRVNGSFVMPGPAEAPPGPAPTPPAAALGLLLALQEQTDTVLRDRRARQHAHAVMQALADLQHAVLSGRGGVESLRTLAELATAGAPAADPALAAILESLSLRAQIELARYGL